MLWCWWMGWWVVGVENGDRGRDGVRLPFEWRDVCLGAVGASCLRVRISTIVGDADADADGDVGGGGLSLVAVDEFGAFVVSVGSLVTRALSTRQLSGVRGALHESLFSVQWAPLAAGVVAESGVGLDGEGWVVLGGGGSGVLRALEDAGIVVEGYEDLECLSGAVSDGARVPGVVLLDARGSVGTAEGEASWVCPVGLVILCVGCWVCCRSGLRMSGGLGLGWLCSVRMRWPRVLVMVWWGWQRRVCAGLVRSAQTENPERVLLVDVDGQDSSLGVLGAVLGSSRESQLAVRDGELLVARLVRMTVPAGDVLDGDGLVSPVTGRARCW